MQDIADVGFPASRGPRPQTSDNRDNGVAQQWVEEEVGCQTRR